MGQENWALCVNFRVSLPRSSPPQRASLLAIVFFIHYNKCIYAFLQREEEPYIMSKPSKGASWLGAFRVAFPRTLPVLAGYLALGAAFGLMLSSIGLSPLWALFMSLVIYAGSGQFLAVTLIASQTSLPQVALLTFLLNFRHFFYGLSMISRYKDAGARKGYLIFAMTDETYALLAGGVPPARVDATDYYFAVSLLDHLYWIGGSLIGAAAGNLITFDTTGVDFAMTALFVVLAVEQWKSNSRHAPALFGLCFGIASLLIFGADLFLIPALIAIAAALLLARRRLEGSAGASEGKRKEQEVTPP